MNHPNETPTLVFKLFARQKPLFEAWRREFAPYLNDSSHHHHHQTAHAHSTGGAHTSCNAPVVELYDSDVLNAEADALVSPANSFGFMDGGFDDLILKRAGLQLQRRLQHTIRTRESGELLIGRAIVLEMVADSEPATGSEDWDATGPLTKRYPERPTNPPLAFRYLVAAPTMRVPELVPNTANAYLAFRAAILAVRAHNATLAASSHRNSLQNDGVAGQTAKALSIRTVACTGLCTGVGRMPAERSARQMRIAFEHAALDRDNCAALPALGSRRPHPVGNLPAPGLWLGDYHGVHEELLKWSHTRTNKATQMATRTCTSSTTRVSA